jgi:hypothetical protein
MLSPTFRIHNIHAGSEPLIIASDDAESIGFELFQSIKMASNMGLSGICLLLSCRDTDWITTGCAQRPWRNYAQMLECPLRGLCAEDAEMIINSWTRYEKRGLGRLYGHSHAEAVAALLKEAHNEANTQEGAFLGAMLRTRLGEDIKAHVQSLLISLAENKAPGGTLRDAFAYIAVPHAENFLSLSRGPLADALGCDRAELKEKVLGPLGEEAIVASYGQFVLTRHRAIAEAAVSILSRDFHIDTDEIMIRLMTSALRLSKTEFVPTLGEWRYLSSYFFRAGKREFGIRLAQAAYESDKDNAYFIVQLARLMREAGQPEASLELFQTASAKVQRDRAFYFEWGISAGVAGKRCNSICLAAASLADNTCRAWPDTEDAKKALTGMGTTFARLYELYRETAFIEACSATAKMGLSFSKDERANFFFQEADARSREAGVVDVPIDKAFVRFTKGVLAAWERRESDLSACIQAVPELEYMRLCQLLHITSADR